MRILSIYWSLENRIILAAKKDRSLQNIDKTYWKNNIPGEANISNQYQYYNTDKTRFNETSYYKLYFTKKLIL